MPMCQFPTVPIAFMYVLLMHEIDGWFGGNVCRYQFGGSYGFSKHESGRKSSFGREKPVAMTMDSVEILRQEGGDEIRVYVSQTEDELNALPTYESQTE